EESEGHEFRTNKMDGMGRSSWSTLAPSRFLVKELTCLFSVVGPAKAGYFRLLLRGAGSTWPAFPGLWPGATLRRPSEANGDKEMRKRMLTCGGRRCRLRVQQEVGGMREVGQHNAASRLREGGFCYRRANVGQTRVPPGRVDDEGEVQPAKAGVA